MIIGTTLLLFALAAEPDVPPTPPAPTAEEAPRKKSLRKKDAPAPQDSKPAPTDDAPIPDTAPPVAPPTEEPPSETDEALDRELGQDLEAANNEGADPLTQIADGMREAEELLAQLDADGKSPAIQNQVLSEIEKLLEQAQNPPPSSNNQNAKKKPQQKRQQSLTQQQQQKQSGKQQQQQNNQANPSERVGPPKSARDEQNPTADQRSVWGHLSEMLREEMGQFAKENFLAKYREEIERYYTDIARQNQPRREP